MQPQENPVRSNRQIDRFIVHGEFEIEPQWAQARLADYLNELDLLAAGADFKSLGISERRHASLPAIITLQGARPQVVEAPEVLAQPADTMPGSFALIRLSGVMRSEDGASSKGITAMLRDLRAAYQNDNIEGILIEANTGGGESLAGTMLRGVLDESPKAVVVWAHLLASAGIAGTLPADEIIGSGESAQFGSIGTFLTVSRWFAQYYNSAYEDIYADKSGNKNREFREFLKGNKEPLTESVNRSNDFFHTEVKKRRPLKGDVEHTLSGAMFYAREAKRRGLIDGIGGFDYALRRLQARVELRKNTKK